jgi:hypothetical protein
MSKRVEAVCKMQPMLRNVDAKILEVFLRPPVDRKRLDCWFAALMVLLETGNLVEALKKLISCLTGTMGSDKVLECALRAIFLFITGLPVEQVIMGFIKCLLGNGGNGGNGDDNIDDPNLREVSRCG